MMKEIRSYTELSMEEKVMYHKSTLSPESFNEIKEEVKKAIDDIIALSKPFTNLHSSMTKFPIYVKIECMHSNDIQKHLNINEVIYAILNSDVNSIIKKSLTKKLLNHVTFDYGDNLILGGYLGLSANQAVNEFLNNLVISNIFEDCNKKLFYNCTTEVDYDILGEKTRDAILLTKDINSCLTNKMTVSTTTSPDYKSYKIFNIFFTVDDKYKYIPGKEFYHEAYHTIMSNVNFKERYKSVLDDISNLEDEEGPVDITSIYEQIYRKACQL